MARNIDPNSPDVDNMTYEQLLEMTYLNSFGDYLKVLLEKTTFNDYLNRKNVYSSLRLETPIMLSFGLDKCLDELLKSEIKINIEEEEQLLASVTVKA